MSVQSPPPYSEPSTSSDTGISMNGSTLASHDHGDPRRPELHTASSSAVAVIHGSIDHSTSIPTTSVSGTLPLRDTIGGHTLFGSIVAPKIKEALKSADELSALIDRCTGTSPRISTETRVQLQKRHTGEMVWSLTKLILETHECGATGVQQQLKQLRALEAFSSEVQEGYPENLIQMNTLWRSSGKILSELQSQLVQHWLEVGVHDLQSVIHTIETTQSALRATQ